MDNDTKQQQPPQWQVFCQLTTRQLQSITREFSAELGRRADATPDPRAERLLRLGRCKLSELNAYLSGLRALELEHLPAAPPADPQHGAAESTPELALRRGQQTSGTTGGAAGISPERLADLGRMLDDELDAFHATRPNLSRAEAAEAFARSPHLTEPSHSELLGRGQPGPKGEAAEGGPAKKGPVTLADHLSLLKGGAA